VASVSGLPHPLRRVAASRAWPPTPMFVCGQALRQRRFCLAPYHFPPLPTWRAGTEPPWPVRGLDCSPKDQPALDLVERRGRLASD